MTSLAVRATRGWLGPGRLLDDVVVLIEGGRVVIAGTSRPRGVLVDTATDEPAPGVLAGPLEPEDVVEVTGFVMPGVADRHVHVGLADPGAILLGGVTAVRDLGWPPEVIFPLADASEGPGFNGPLIRAVGPILTCPGGYPTRSGWAPAGTGLEVRGPEEAAAAVEAVLRRSGVGVVKVALNAEAGPTLSDAELVAACDAAHGRGAVVTAHCQGPGQAERALGAGVDEFAHCPWSERLSDDLVEAAARRVRMVSTLHIHAQAGETPGLRTALDNQARFLAAGGAVVYGTDLGNGPIPPGIDLEEVRLLARSGLRGERLLEAMAFRPLAPGEPGDLIAFAGDPSEDPDVLGEAALVVRAGRVVRP